MQQESMFEVDKIPKVGSKMTAYGMKAVNWYSENYNLRPEISVVPDIRFTSKDLHETHSVKLKDVIDEYKAHVKEEAKRRAREKSNEKPSLY